MTNAEARFNKIHIRKVYACLAVTCHLHFWQNDRDFLRATVVTRGWNGYRNKSQHRKSTLEKKFSRRSSRDSNPRPFNHESGALTTELSPPPGGGQIPTLTVYNDAGGGGRGRGGGQIPTLTVYNDAGADCQVGFKALQTSIRSVMLTAHTGQSLCHIVHSVTHTLGQSLCQIVHSVTHTLGQSLCVCVTLCTMWQRDCPVCA